MDSGIGCQRKNLGVGAKNFSPLHLWEYRFWRGGLGYIFGALIWVANLYFRKKELAWTAFILFVIGLAAAFVASYSLHPHTQGLTVEAQRILYLHDFWAFTTIRVGTVGAVLMLINLFVLPKKRPAMLLVGLVLLISAYAVSMAGHYGAHLVHIEGVQGNYLDTHEH